MWGRGARGCSQLTTKDCFEGGLERYQHVRCVACCPPTWARPCVLSCSRCRASLTASQHRVLHWITEDVGVDVNPTQRRGGDPLARPFVVTAPVMGQLMRCVAALQARRRVCARTSVCVNVCARTRAPDCERVLPGALWRQVLRGLVTPSQGYIAWGSRLRCLWGDALRNNTPWRTLCLAQRQRGG